MNTPENLTTAIAHAMEGAGYGISDQLYNALEAEFAEALKVDHEDGDFTSIDTFLVALEYAAHRASIARSNQ